MILCSLQDYSAERKTQQHQAPALPSCCCWEYFPCCITAPSNPPHWRWPCIFYYETVTEQDSSSPLLQQVRVSKTLLFSISSTFSVCRWVGGKSRLKKAGQVHHCVFIRQNQWWMLSFPQQSFGHYSVNFTDHSRARLSLKLVMVILGSPNLLPAPQ